MVLIQFSQHTWKTKCKSPKFRIVTWKIQAYIEKKKVGFLDFYRYSYEALDLLNPPPPNPVGFKIIWLAHLFMNAQIVRGLSVNNSPYVDEPCRLHMAQHVRGNPTDNSP